MHFAIVYKITGYFLLTSAAAYIVLVAIAVLLRRYRERGPAAADDGVSVLKPLCGDEPRLYENLRSFCEQDHPNYQILFGIRDASDAAVAVARRLQAEFPRRDIAVIVDPRVHGRNLKVSNLLNLLPHARWQRLVFADSDIAVGPDYLRSVTAPLARPEVGLVTCLYRGRSNGGLWSCLGAQFIDDWFRPSVALLQMTGGSRFSFGATLALRRDTLAAIGGLETVADRIADDFWLGERIADQGFKTVLSDHEVLTDVIEPTLADLVARELRWLRTIRSVRPLSYAFTGICFTLPVVLIGIALAGVSTLSVTLAAAAVTGRSLLFVEGWISGARSRSVLRNVIAFLLRDALSLLLWARALRSGTVHWRGQNLSIDTQSEMRVS